MAKPTGTAFFCSGFIIDRTEDIRFASGCQTYLAVPTMKNG
jgi:hypothetical protein